MSALSDYLENELADHILGGSDYARPGTVYFALFTAAPTDAGGGTEVSGGSYARKAVTNNATNFPSAVAGVKTTGADVTFVTATGSWGEVVAYGIYDAATGGNLLFHGTLTTARTVESGDTPKFPSGSFSLTFN